LSSASDPQFKSTFGCGDEHAAISAGNEISPFNESCADESTHRTVFLRRMPVFDIEYASFQVDKLLIALCEKVEEVIPLPPSFCAI